MGGKEVDGWWTRKRHTKVTVKRERDGYWKVYPKAFSNG